MDEQKKTLSIAALVLGIVGIIFDFIVTWVGIVAGIVGIVLAVQARKKEGGNSMATAGLVCSIIAVALGGVMYICAICALGALFSIAANI